MNIYPETSKDFENVEKFLKLRQKQVEDELMSLEKDDPASGFLPAESSESGVDAWEADVHTKVALVKISLLDLTKKISSSLNKIKNGTYGKCEKCGQAISIARLHALPTATNCMTCL